MHVVVPEAEAILDHAFPVLNQGFVRLVDYLGGDARIVQAARVSYGPGTKTVREDRGLIHYLMRNRHTSPFEMVRLLFHVKLPIFVARQWIRHRTACLTGDTVVAFVDDTRRASAQGEKTLFALWKMWNGGGSHPRANTGWWDAQQRVRNLKLRVLNESTREFTVGHIRDVVFTGINPIYRFTLSNGRSISMTENHRVYTDRGWRKMREAVGLEQSTDGDMVMTRPCSLLAKPDFSTHSHYTMGNVAYKVVAQPVAVVSMEYLGEQPTYDVCMEGPWHNFVANDLVVHNSVNEVSGRYSVMADEFYAPLPEDIRFQSKRNKQGRSEEEAVPRELQAKVLEILLRGQKSLYTHYEEMLREDIARELARINLPLSLYTQWYWQIDLHNLLHFLQLRLDPHAQQEIRAYAEVVAQITKAVAPIAYEAFEEYILHGVSFSRSEMQALRALLRGENNPLTGRAQQEFEAKLGFTTLD